MGWTLRVLRHRAAAQSTLLAAVLAVALVGATLLGTFALLLHVSETRAVGEALGRASAAGTDLDVVLTLDHGDDPAAALAATDGYYDDLLGGIDSQRSAWLTSNPLHVGTGSRLALPMAYLAAGPAIPEHARLVDGAWPDVAVDADGRVPVAVPLVAADAHGWRVGSVLPTLDGVTYLDQELVVVGVHELEGPGSVWRRDLIEGAQYNPSWPIPGTFGFLSGPIFGPFVVVPEALVDGPATLAGARVVAEPDLGAATGSQIDALRTALVDGQTRLVGAVDAEVSTARLATFLPATVDEAVGNLAVTRVSLVVVGLMLVVLAVTVLLLAARLLAERRASEQTLMASRGASNGQLVRLAALEAAGVAVVTALVAPWLARLTYDAVTRIPVLDAAGLHVDPGTPPTLWVTCGVVALLLAGVLLQPLLRRRGSAVEAEQQLVRQDRRGALARSGADVALLVLAGVGVWQLQGYRSPVLTEPGGGARIDPVLVTAPALLLLAGAVLGLRVLPLVARLGERLATRSRSLVAPLGAWEVGRRPGRASGAVLLLTIAVAVASFSQSFLGTWRISQQDQSDLAVGADLRIDRLPSSPLEQSRDVAALAGPTVVSPVTERQVSVGGSLRSRDDSRQPAATLVAVDTRSGGDLLRGRSAAGWDAVTEPLRPRSAVEGIPLPGTVDALLVDVATAATPSHPGEVVLTLVVEDSQGVRFPLEPTRVLPLGDSADDVRVDLPAAADGLSLVAVVGRILPAEPEEEEQDDRGTRSGLERQSTVTVDLTDVRVVAPGADDDTDGVMSPVDVADATWDSVTRGDLATGAAIPMSVLPVQGGVRIGGTVNHFSIDNGLAEFATTTFVRPELVPAVVSDTLANQMRVGVGDTLAVDVGSGHLFGAQVTEVLPFLPGHPRGSVLLVDHDLLTRATLGAASADPMLDEWWAQVPDDRAAQVAAAVLQADLGEPTSRVAVRDAATDGPLRIGVQAALWIVTVAALALAFAGFAMSATVSVRTRRLELARLQALGASRGGIVRSVLVEHAIIGVLGVAAGLAIGGLLASVLGPLLTVSAVGLRPVPRALVQWTWPEQLALVAALTGLVALAVAVTTNALLRRASGALLRLGDER